MAYKTKKKSTRNSRPVWLLGAIAVVVIGLIALAALVLKPSGNVQTYPLEISVTQAQQKWAGKAFILDVREPEEWNQVHIPGATLIPLGQLPDRLNEIPNDQEVVVVCRSGNRSATGRDILLNAGFTQVTSMAGGMNQWQAAGFTIVSGQ